MDPARLGRPGAARGVRQRRQPVPRPLGGEAARGRRASGARRGQRRHRALLPEPRARCCRSRAVRSGWCSPGAPSICWSRSDRRTCRGSRRSASTASSLAFTFVLSLADRRRLAARFPLLRLGPLAVSLHESGRGNTASRGRHRARHLLMGGQVALALVLLVASGLMLRSFQKLRAVDPGFDATSALTFRVGLPRSRLSGSRTDGRRAPGDPRSPVGAARRNRGLRIDLPAARRMRCCQAGRCLSKAGPCRRARSRRSSLSAPSPAATSRRWACGSFAAAASIAATSSATSRRRRERGAGQRRLSRIRIRSASGSGSATRRCLQVRPAG